MNAPNIASLLHQQAREHPDQTALRVLTGGRDTALSFRELNEESNRLAGGLVRYGLLQGHRVLVMVPPGIEFIALTFALFRIGAVPVLIDPGLGRDPVLGCIRHVRPQGLVAVPRAHAARFLHPSAFEGVKVRITVGRRWFWGGPTLHQVRRSGRRDFATVGLSGRDPAAILFTSGSTGPPKGVVYTHQMFFEQVRALQRVYGIQPGEIDLPTFPLFALFGVALGMTCVIPEMDATRPASVHPPNIIEPIHRFGVQSSFGSPALWDTVTRYCQTHGLTLPSLRRILIAGAPVGGPLLERFDDILSPEAQVFTPYGATEALPVSHIERREILGETWAKTQSGAGACVGPPVPGMNVRIMPLMDEPVERWDDALELPVGVRGEIVVESPWVTQQYFELPEATAAAKIGHADHYLHRMGDIGYRDEQGRLWFCGRKSQRVNTADGPMFTIPCEAVFNRHPAVKRSALVGLGENGRQRPVLVVELHNPKLAEQLQTRLTLVSELLEQGAEFEHTRNIRDILFHPAFPVDVRHNAKISRETLAAWAARHLPLE